MAAECAKVRFAMGVFEDLPQLDKAATALIALGLDPAGLCFAAARAALAPADDSLWVLAEHTPQLSWFEYRGRTPRGPSEDKSEKSAVALSVAALNEAIAASRRRSPASDVWNTINPHLENGAFLLVAPRLTAAQQEQATRTLLRHSRQPVHAGEFPSSAELGREGKCIS
jgi:hypothetical protein